MLVIGSINADLVVTLDRLPEAGETVTGGRFARHGGGKGANQAVAAARAGARVRFVGAVGDDDLGAAAIEQLAAEGVDVGAIARLDGEATGVALIAVDREGRNQIAVASGANARVDAALVARALEAAALGPGDVVLLGFEVPDAAVVAGARAAAEAGARAILNPAPARDLPGGVLGHGVLLTPNGLEAAALTGETEPAAAARALARRTGAPVLVTVGADGALLADGDAHRRDPPRRRSRSSTRPAPATRSTASWPPGSPPAPASRTRRAAPWRPRRPQCGGRARAGRVRAALAQGTVRYDVADGVATIALDQPETRNALSDELLDDLLAAFARGPRRRRRALRRARRRTHETTFSAGGNLGRLRGRRAAGPQAPRDDDEVPARCSRSIGELGKPVAVRRQRPLPRGRARARARVRPDRSRARARRSGRPRSTSASSRS